MDFKQIFRRLFQFVAIFHIMGLVLTLIGEAGGKRDIAVKQIKDHGYIAVNNTKINTKVTEATSIVNVKCDSIFAYLFLTAEKDGNFTTSCVKLAMWCFILLYITTVDLSDPFDYKSFRLVSLIGILYISSFALSLIGYYYSRNWFLATYHPSGKEAYLSSSDSGIGVLTTVMIVAFYRIATYNQQQLAITRSV